MHTKQAVSSHSCNWYDYTVKKCQTLRITTHDSFSPSWTRVAPNGTILIFFYSGIFPLVFKQSEANLMSLWPPFLTDRRNIHKNLRQDNYVLHWFPPPPLISDTTLWLKVCVLEPINHRNSNWRMGNRCWRYRIQAGLLFLTRRGSFPVFMKWRPSYTQIDDAFEPHAQNETIIIKSYQD